MEKDALTRIEHDLHPHAHHAGGADDVEHVHFLIIALLGVFVDFSHLHMLSRIFLVPDAWDEAEKHGIKVD